MAQMPQPPAQSPQAQPPQAAQGKGGGPAQLVEAIHGGLMQLMDLPLPDPAKQQLQAIMQGFESFVDSVGGAGGNPPGPGNAPPAQQGQMPASGGPNAVPRM